MAREYDPQRALTRRTTRVSAGDRGTVYVGGRGVVVLMPPGRLGRWYERARELAEMLIDVVEKLDNLIYGRSHRQQPTLPPADPSQLGVPSWLDQVRYLGAKAGHAPLLALYLAWRVLRGGPRLAAMAIKHLRGIH